MIIQRTGVTDSLRKTGDRTNDWVIQRGKSMADVWLFLCGVATGCAVMSAIDGHPPLIFILCAGLEAIAWILTK
jgi:hypothetical protein